MGGLGKDTERGRDMGTNRRMGVKGKEKIELMRSTGQGPTNEKSCLCVSLASKAISIMAEALVSALIDQLVSIAFQGLDEEVRLVKDVDEDVKAAEDQ
ncbi:hypothetical protein TorRG33x02_260010 [Trema orientale]|uniref:Uncharacterized protein n=1 Tax=Trema orientale TaxID=63057 RepID=A0A2P5D7B6_TREOI|nr:hypothetical protein TorRG33x02_260010 [Trema orientale]